jgi:hypothetical protein
VWGSEGTAPSFLNSTLQWGEWSVSRLGRFTAGNHWTGESNTGHPARGYADWVSQPRILISFTISFNILYPIYLGTEPMKLYSVTVHYCSSTNPGSISYCVCNLVRSALPSGPPPPHQIDFQTIYLLSQSMWLNLRHYPSIHLSICLSVCLSIYLPTYLSI